MSSLTAAFCGSLGPLILGGNTENRLVTLSLSTNPLGFSTEFSGPFEQSTFRDPWICSTVHLFRLLLGFGYLSSLFCSLWILYPSHWMVTWLMAVLGRQVDLLLGGTRGRQLKGRQTDRASSVLGNIKNKQTNKKRTGTFQCLCQQLSAPVAWPAMHWWAMADLFLSHGDSNTELHNLSTQLPRFLLVGHEYTSPVLQIPPRPLWCISGKPMLCCRTFLSWTLMSLPCEGKRNTNLVLKQWCNSISGSNNQNLILQTLLKSDSSCGESLWIQHDTKKL